MKKSLVLIFLCIFMFTLTGCVIKDQTYTGGGVSIRLKSDFKEYDHPSWDYYLYNDDQVAFMVTRYTRHQTLQGVDLSKLTLEEYMNFCIATNEFEATVFIVERPIDQFDPFCYCYFTDANDKFGYMMIVMTDENYYYNMCLSTTYEDFQNSKQMLMEYSITIRLVSSN